MIVNPIINPVFWWRFMDPTHNLTINPSDYNRYGFLNKLPQGKYPEYESCELRYGHKIAHPSMRNIWCSCCFYENHLHIEYLQYGGEKTLVLIARLTDKEIKMLWKMFIPYASFLSQNHAYPGFSLGKTLRMLKVVSHMTHGDHLLKTELHEELKTRFLSKNLPSKF